MRWPLVPMLLVAGCASPAMEVVAPPALPWGIAACAFAIVAVPVDADALAALLPEGFAPAPGRLSALPAGPRASIELDAYRCASGTWGNETLADMPYGSVYAAVVPPDALREPGYEAYFVKWDAIVAADGARAALAAAGLPAREGEARVAFGPGGAVSVRAGFEGGGFSFEGVMEDAADAGAPLPFMEFTPREGGGLARWHARLHDASIGAGAGIVELPTGWVRDLVGAPRAPATFIAGTWNLDEADVSW